MIDGYGIWATTQDWGISMFDATKSMLPMVEVMGAAGQQAVGIVGGFTSVRDIIGVTKKLFTMETLEVVANSFAKVGNLMTTTALGVGSGLASAGVWALTTAQTALNAAFVASPWGWVALAIGAVVAAIVWAYNEFDAFRELIDSIGKGLKSAFTTAAKFFGWNVGEDKATATAKVASPPKVAEPPKTQTELQKVAETTKKETKDKKTKTSADSIMAGGTKAINIKFENVKFADKVEIIAQTMDGAIDDVELKCKQMFARVLNGSMMLVDQ